MPTRYLEIAIIVNARNARRNTAQVEAIFKNIERSANRMGATVRTSMGQADRATQGYIRTAIDLVATMRTTAQVASQLGTSLRSAASGAAVKQAFDNLTRFSGIAANELVNNMKRAAKGTAAEIDLLRIANRAMLAGGIELAEKIPRIFEIARAASIASGQDISFVFDTLVKGIVKGSYLLIDNAEIYIRIGQAINEYAESLGKATEDLTFHERQLGILNAVLREGDKFVEKIGSDVSVATDQFDQWSARIRDAKQDIGEFVNRLGPVGPLLATAADLFQSSAPVLTAYVLLKQQATAAAAAHAAALTTETAAMSAQAIAGKEAAAAILARGGAQRAAAAATAGWSALGVAGAVGGGLLAGYTGFELVARKIVPTLKPANQTISKGADLLQYWVRRAIEGKFAADEWFRGVNGMETAADRMAAAVRRNYGELEKLTDGYYESEIAIRKNVGTMRAQEDAYRAARQLAEEAIELQERAKAIGLESADAYEILKKALDETGIGVDLLKAKLDGLAVAFGETTAEQAKAKAQLDLLGQVYALGAVTLQDVTDLTRQVITGEAELNTEYYKGLVAASELGQIQSDLLDNRVQQILVNKRLAHSEYQLQQSLRKSIDEARARAGKDRARAAAELAQKLEEINRRHAQRVEDIQRRHRRRLQDIEYNYRKTVEQAAIDRDALAIVRARETRQEQLRDAEMDRQESLLSEQISYQESIMQAQQAHQERLARISEALAEEIKRERDAYAQELADQRKFHADQLAELRQTHRNLEAEEAAHQARMGVIRARGRRWRPSGVGGRTVNGETVTANEQRGGSGIVTGPALFRVEPGVTEAFWFSGAFNRAGASPMPGQAMQPASRSLNVNVGGRLDVSGLPARISGLVQQGLGQLLVDALTQSFIEMTG